MPRVWIAALLLAACGSDPDGAADFAAAPPADLAMAAVDADDASDPCAGAMAAGSVREFVGGLVHGMGYTPLTASQLQSVREATRPTTATPTSRPRSCSPRRARAR